MVAYVYVAKHYAPLLNILFQGGVQNLDLDGFQFELVQPDFVWDTVRYTLTYGNFIAQLTVIGIDCTFRA